METYENAIVNKNEIQENRDEGNRFKKMEIAGDKNRILSAYNDLF